MSIVAELWQYFYANTRSKKFRRFNGEPPTSAQTVSDITS